MEITSLSPLYAWSAFLSAAATLLTFITGILFFAKGQPYGSLNDISSIFQVLLMAPLVVLLLSMTSINHPFLGILAALTGISGILLSALGQGLLVFKRIDFEGSLKFFPAGAAIGAWLILACSLMLGDGTLPPLLAWLGIFAGTGYVLAVAGFLRGGQQHILFYVGALMLVIGYPAWAIWLGRLLLSHSL
jgi:hypothetical protein